MFAAFIFLPTRFWPRIDRELPFLAIAHYPFYKHQSRCNRYLVPNVFFDARLVRSNRLVKSSKMQQNAAKTGWELTKVARIGRSRSVYGQKRVERGVGRSREPKLSVCCLRTSAHPFLAKNRPGAPVFGHCPFFVPPRSFPI